MARDSGAGHGQTSLSVYRHIDVFDIASETEIKGSTYDCPNCSIASSDGVLKPGITPATYCSFIDFNINSHLNRFRVHNRGAQDARLLHKKWESIGIAPMDRLVGDNNEWFVLA
jgi:hypothetical protein